MKDGNSRLLACLLYATPSKLRKTAQILTSVSLLRMKFIECSYTSYTSLTSLWLRRKLARRLLCIVLFCFYLVNITMQIAVTTVVRLNSSYRHQKQINKRKNIQCSRVSVLTISFY